MERIALSGAVLLASLERHVRHGSWQPQILFPSGSRTAWHWSGRRVEDTHFPALLRKRQSTRSVCYSTMRTVVEPGRAYYGLSILSQTPNKHFFEIVFGHSFSKNVRNKKEYRRRI